MEGARNPLARRCPRLGSSVAFSYCMAPEAGGPCFKVLDCWWETFDIVGYLQDQLSPERFQQVMNARPQPKVASLLEMINQAKERLTE